MKRNNALYRIRKSFPNVTKVKDATESLIVEVSEADSSRARKKDPNNCALAVACKRHHLAEGAIIGIAYSWLIKGDQATRYKTSVGVGREITSFDRHQDFAADTNYMLSKVPPAARMGFKKTLQKTGPRTSTKPVTQVVHKHQTQRIRVIKR